MGARDQETTAKGGPPLRPNCGGLASHFFTRSLSTLTFSGVSFLGRTAPKWLWEVTPAVVSAQGSGGLGEGDPAERRRRLCTKICLISPFFR